MTARSYCLLAAAVFAVMAVLQLSRAIGLWPTVMVGSTPMPDWPSWVAFVVAGGLAWLGYRASRA